LQALGKQLDEKAGSEVKDACKLALQHTYEGLRSPGLCSVPANVESKAEHVAAAITSGEKACVYVGTYQDCKTICCKWESSHSVAVVLKTGMARDASQDMARWRSGHVQFSVAQDQIGLLMALHKSPAFSQFVAAEMLRALSAAAGQWARVASNTAMHMMRELGVDILKGIAVLETICGRADVFPRVGSKVKLEVGSVSRNTCRAGVVVRCDHLMGTMSILPLMALSSKSLQPFVLTSLPISGLATVDTMANKPFLLDKKDAVSMVRILVDMHASLQAVSSLQSTGVSTLSCWSSIMQSRVFCALSHMLQHDLVQANHLAGSGVMRALVDHAIENATCCDPSILELRRSHVISALCESPDKAPAALLGAARSPGPGGGGPPPGGSDGSSGGAGAVTGGMPKAQRNMPSVDFIIRSSRTTQRQDQRRTRELAAAELAEITTQPLRLCQLALERENGNQDRAANWLFEQGEAFLAENPEFAEVPEDSRGGGAGGAAGASQDTDTPLFLLYDAFSYYEDMQALVLWTDGEQAIGAVSAGMGDLPPSMLDELRAFGHVPSDEHGIRVHDDPLSLVLGRSRGVSSVHVSSGASQRRDDKVRAGHFAMLTEMDLLSDPSNPLGKQLVGKTVYVESLERPDGQQAKVTLYDSATAMVKTIMVPITHLEKVNHRGVPMGFDVGSEGAIMKASVDVEGKLASVYARNCLRWMLEGWPEDWFRPSGEAFFGGRQRLVALAHAAALGTCCNLADIPTPVPCVSKLAVDRDGSLSEILCRRLSALLAGQMGVSEHEDAHDDSMLRPHVFRHKRERERAVAEKTSIHDSEEPDEGREKRRCFVLERSEEPVASQASTTDQEFHKNLLTAHEPAVPLIQFLTEECVAALKLASSCQTIVEQASEHPYVRTASNTGANSRRCLHMEGVWALMVVFDSRCALLPGESLRFYSDAACSELIATAAMDDRRKGFLPLVLPSPVWMQLSATASGGADDVDHNWGFRVQAFPLGEPNLAHALWLSQLIVPQQHRLTVEQDRLTLLEALLDILDKTGTLAAPHAMQVHRLVMTMMHNLPPSADAARLLREHTCFVKLTDEATLRQQWEKKVPSSGARQDGQTARCPHSKYLCSLSELLANRSLALRRVSCLEHTSMELPAPVPVWLSSLENVMSIVASMYRGKQQQLESFIHAACTHWKAEALLSAGGAEQDATNLRMLEGGQLSGAAKDALSELFHVEPDAPAQLSRHLHPPQAPAHNKRDFLLQAQALIEQDPHKMAELTASFGLDCFLVRWGPDRDADLVALVNMLSETDKTQGSPSALDQVMVDKLKLTEYHLRKFPRLGSVPEVSLKRRLLLLKLLNKSLDACLVAIDFSRRTCPSALAASVCELQHLIFHQTKAAMHNAVIEWTTCPQVRAGALQTREVLVHRPGRRARDIKEKADENERWRLHISGDAAAGLRDKLEEFLVAPSDFGSAREMAADATVSARLVVADPPNGAVPLRNAHEVRGNIALIERGGGQFVNVVRRAQEAGAVGVVMTDSKEGPLFLMSTELGNSGDDVEIPAVLLSLADSMLLLQRQHPVTATIWADGVLMQTYRQLRYVPAARLRQRDDMAWQVKFQGEGHEGYQGPYREAISAMCAELQSPQLKLLVPCANAVGEVGDNRDKFLPCPSARSQEQLDVFFFLGQLMGVAIRTRNLLNLDLPPLVWKSLVGIELDDDDLKATDFSCWNALQFRDHNGQGITAAKFSELLHQCRFTCCLTDGSEVPLLRDGHAIPVTFERREEYARLVIKTRLNESAEQLAKMRAGICSVIPEQLLGFMTWEELERRVCGSAEIDIASLKRHTQYRLGVDKDSTHVKMFWEVLESFSQTDRRLFLRFAYEAPPPPSVCPLPLGSPLPPAPPSRTLFGPTTPFGPEIQARSQDLALVACPARLCGYSGTRTQSEIDGCEGGR
jgi:hypothetical protein